MKHLLLLVLFCAAAFPQEEDQLRASRECAKISKVIEAYLGPKFTKPVSVRLVTREWIADFARRLDEKLTPPGMHEIVQKLSVRLRQIPEGFDLKEKTIELLKKVVAGLYDPDEDTYYLVRSVAPAGSVPFVMTAAHELVHAYRDVDKDYWPRTKRLVFHDMDWAYAGICLVEGDATLLGQAFVPVVLGGNDADTMVKYTARLAEGARQSIRMAVGAQVSEFPFALREMLIGRYAEGFVFTAAIYKQGGVAALDAAYDHPPRSTEQVLHPEKYLAAMPDEPVFFTGGDPTAALGAGWKMLMTNTMGELDFRVQFSEKLGTELAEEAAAGWDGARFWFCEKADTPTFVGILSTWDTERDALQFASTWAQWAAVRDGDVEHKITLGEGGSARVPTTDGLVVVRVMKRDVLVADGVPADRVEAVLLQMATAGRAERKADAQPK